MSTATYTENLVLHAYTKVYEKRAHKLTTHDTSKLIWNSHKRTSLLADFNANMNYSIPVIWII